MRAIRLGFWLVPLLLSVGMAAAVDSPSEKERAVAALERNVQADPGNADLWVHLGFAYRKMERLDESLAAFEKAAALDPGSQESLYMLGLIYEKQKRDEDALRAWKRYLSVVTDPEKRAVAENHIHRLGGR